MSQAHKKLGRDGTHGVESGAADVHIPEPGEFDTRPSDALIEAFLQHVRETGEPENFPSITTTKPAPDSPPVFLRRFSIDRRKRRDGDMAPCPICSPAAPKYLNDAYLVWYPEERVLRAIGPECGDSVFGGTQYAEAKATFDLAERERLAVEFLQKNLPKALSMLVALRSLADAADEAERLHDQLRKRAPRIHAALRALKKGGGAISVSIVTARDKNGDDARAIGPRGFSKAGSEYDSTEEVFGYLPDTPAILTKFKPAQALQPLLQQLMDLPQLQTSEEAFLWACDESDNLLTLEAAVATLRNCSAGYVEISGRLDRFADFFSSGLFEKLNLWGEHEENSFRMHARASDGVFRLEHVAHWNDREKVILRPDMTKLMRRGNLPGFD